jgi:hypothetical protein
MSKKERELPETARRPGQVKHGISTFLRTGKISPSVRGFRRIQKYLREIERDLIADLGGQENLTAAREILIKSTIQAYGCLILAGAYTQRHGLLRPDQARKEIIELQPVLGHQFIAFQNCIRQNLVVLGLDRKRAGEPLDLGQYITEKYGPDSQAAGQGPGKEMAKTKKGRRVRVEGEDQSKDEGSVAEAPREGHGKGGGDD